MTKYLFLLLKVALSAGLVWYAFHRIDFASAWAAMAAIPAMALGVALGLMFLQTLLSSFRLQELLRQMGWQYRVGPALNTVLVGAFFSQTFISFLGGDAMRVWRMVGAGVPGVIATKSVVLDRISGLGGMVALMLIAMPLLVPMLDNLEIRLVLFAFTACILGGVLGVFLLRRLPEPRKDRGLLSRLARFISLGLEIARSGRGLFYVLGLSLLIQVANVLILFELAQGLSIRVSLVNCFVFMPTVLFLSMLPISFAGWGVREGAMVAMLAIVGVPAHESLALSICFGVCLVFVSLPGGVLWFANKAGIGNSNESVASAQVRASVR